MRHLYIHKKHWQTKSVCNKMITFGLVDPGVDSSTMSNWNQASIDYTEKRDFYYRHQILISTCTVDLNDGRPDMSNLSKMSFFIANNWIWNENILGANFLKSSSSTKTTDLRPHLSTNESHFFKLNIFYNFLWDRRFRGNEKGKQTVFQNPERQQKLLKHGNVYCNKHDHSFVYNILE
jgi:hypothetical protein